MDDKTMIECLRQAEFYAYEHPEQPLSIFRHIFELAADRLEELTSEGAGTQK